MLVSAPKRNRHYKLFLSARLSRDATPRNQEAEKPSASAFLNPLESSAAMEVFEGAEFVRLRSLEHGTYLHAAEDGRGVLLDARRASHHAAWAVQRLQASGGGGGRGTRHVLLRGVYGRYLGAPDPRWSLLPCRRRAATQRDRDEREIQAIMWRAVGTGASAGVVLLHDAHGRYLRANWRRLPCRSGVAVAGGGCLGPTMQWAVEVIPWTHARPELPITSVSEWVKLFDWACAPLASVRRWVWRTSQQREIRWVRANDSGNFSEEDWASFQYSGRSTILLRSELAHLTLQFYRLMVCIRAGRHGQPTPLVTDLPRSREPLDIVVLRAHARAADQFIFPDVDKETASPAVEGVFL
ncbi:uncharacterized protein LOC133898792 [Phragmites australis]|uniref:uncharacterized protein LOC133898792 n=1 Tax=Phragmites australis TaxID=29695 RepID=UPI002D77C874|nr:uncharacterized protein LOC133898792 [Phragmites australis]